MTTLKIRKKKKRSNSSGTMIRYIILLLLLMMLIVTIIQYAHLPDHGDFHSNLNSIFQLEYHKEGGYKINDNGKNEEGESMEEGRGIEGIEGIEEVQNFNNDYPFYDKEKLMGMLRSMGVDPYSIDNSTWAQVPTWKEITQVWGDKPRVYGLDSCPAFNDAIPAYKRRLAVGGIFSTGTNLMAQLLQHNCGIPERIKWMGSRAKGHGMEWQVPWGKHNPYRYRSRHEVKDFLFSQKRHQAKLEEYMPVVSTRDPYDWMKSMCKHSYTLRWNHKKGDLSKKCPGMLDSKGNVNEITGKFGADSINRIPFNNSLAGVWNTFYGEYFHHLNGEDKPLLMIRFEDIVFFPKEITKTVCECVGGELMKPIKVYSDHDTSVGDFHYVVGTAVVGKGHGPVKNHRNGIVDSWIKYSKPRSKQKDQFSDSDLKFIRRIIDRNMMEFFNYPVF